MPKVAQVIWGVHCHTMLMNRQGWRQAGDPRGTHSPLPVPTVPTLLVAVQVDNLLQADGHGIVPVDAGSGGSVKACKISAYPTVQRGSDASRPHPGAPPPFPLGPQHLCPILPRLYLPFFWSQNPNFPRLPSSLPPVPYGR